jgi:transposase-like protein
MNSKPRKKFSNEFRAKVALEAVKGSRTISEICSAHGVASTQVSGWKKQLLDGAPDIFAGGGPTSSTSRREEEITDPLLKEIGRLQVENAFLKKKCMF